MLERLGRFCHRRHRWVVVAWVLLAAVGFGLGSHVFDRLQQATYAAPRSESVRGSDLLSDTAGTGTQVVVLVDGKRALAPKLRAAVERAVGDIRTQPHVLQAVDWYATGDPGMRSRDHRATTILVELDGDLSTSATDAARDRVARAAGAIEDDVPGVTVKVGGESAVYADLDRQVEQDMRLGELIALPLVLIALVLVFGGLVAALLPVVSAVGAIALSLLALLGFSYAIDVDSNAVSITTLLGLGLSVDYALLMVNRYREERGRGLDGAGAVGRTVAVAGRTVLFSALTVATALSSLLAFRVPAFHTFAVAGITIVLVAALAALTLTPALLGLAGRWIRVPSAPLPDDGFFARLARGVRRVAPLVALGVAALLLLAGSPFLRVEFGAIGTSALPASAESRQVDDTLNARFPQHDPNQLTVVAEVPAKQLRAYGRDVVRGLPGVDTTHTVNVGGGVSTMTVTPADPAAGTTPERAAEDVVRDVRAHPAGFATYTIGPPAQLVDLRDDLRDRLPWALTILVLGTFVLLFLMTGSVLIPVKALVMNALSLGASFGVLVLVFQDGHLSSLLGFDPVGTLDLFIPVLVFAFAFGLSMDYEVFLLSRVKEAYDAGRPNDRAVELGLQRSGRIVTSAALVVVLVCSGFVFGRLIPIKEMGVALAVAVAVDATLVRCLLVPATMSLLGRANWWAPRWLRAVHRRLGLHHEPVPTTGAAVDGPAPSANGTHPAGPVVRRYARTVPTAGGRAVPVRLHVRDDDGPVLVFWPAMGVPASYYTPFADALAGRGCSVAVPDLPGQGDSATDVRTTDVGYADLLAGDLPDTLAAVRAELPGRPLLTGGHSLGGQLAVLATALDPAAADGLVLVAAGTPWYRRFPGRRRQAQIFALTRTVAGVTRLKGYWPGERYRFGGTQPATLIADWARSARTGRYVVGDRDLGPLLGQLRLPVLAVSVDGDDLAPRSLVQDLCRRLPVARLTRRHHVPAEAKAGGHLGWVRRPGDLVGVVAGWTADVRPRERATVSAQQVRAQ